MIRNVFLSINILFLFSFVNAQTGMEVKQILKSIEENNKELQAFGYFTEAMKAEAKTENNLADPSVNYSYLFGSPQNLGKNGELTITQEFDFPTVYGSRSKLNRLRSSAYDKQYELKRREILLAAQSICLNLVLLNQQKVLLDSLLNHSIRLSQVYENRLQSGDANILEINKVKMELLKTRSEVMTNSAERETKIQELIALNGNIPLSFTAVNYDFQEELTPYEILKDEYLRYDTEVQIWEKESAASKQQITVNKSGWLPKLEVGYRRDTGKGEQFNGFILGTSIPIFENKNRVKVARAQNIYAELQKENLENYIITTLWALYSEAMKTKELMEAYDLTLLNDTKEFLRIALEERQISITEYYTELEAIYQTQENYLLLENRYQEIVAEILKYKL